MEGLVIYHCSAAGREQAEIIMQELRNKGVEGVMDRKACKCKITPISPLLYWGKEKVKQWCHQLVLFPLNLENMYTEMRLSPWVLDAAPMPLSMGSSKMKGGQDTRAVIDRANRRESASEMRIDTSNNMPDSCRAFF